jgi:hypothetical protein
MMNMKKEYRAELKQIGVAVRRIGKQWAAADRQQQAVIRSAERERGKIMRRSRREMDRLQKRKLILEGRLS